MMLQDLGHDSAVRWTCPLHPELGGGRPGTCPMCGTTLARSASDEAAAGPELVYMRRRFWVCLVLTLPVLALSMRELLHGRPPGLASGLVQLFFATPVVVWGGWPFFVRSWDSVVRRRPGLFTIVWLGVAAAYLFSVVAVLASIVSPRPLPVYFGSASAVVTLVLLGQILRRRREGAVSAVRSGEAHDGSTVGV